MTNIKIYLYLLLSLVGLSTTAALAQSAGIKEVHAATSSDRHSDELILYFQLAKDHIDPAFRGNDSLLLRMDRLFRMLLEPDAPYHTDSVVVIGSASPLGGETYNRALSERRTAAMAALLRERMQVPDSLIVSHSLGANWQGLRAMVENSQMQYKKEVLEVIDNVPVMKGRNTRLMNLKAGKPYREMMKTFFPDLQSAAPVIVYTKQLPLEPVWTPSPSRATPDEIAPLHPAPLLSEVAPVRVPVAQANGRPQKQPLLNISTNVLYYAALAPNIGIEYCLPWQHWSVNAELVHPWWKKPSQHKYYQIRQFSGEARYWLRGDGDYRGHFFGAYGNGGVYDLENGGTGYKGEFWGVGVTYGYLLRLTPRFRLEFSIGGGFISTQYEQYEPIDKHYVYEKTVRTGYFGPTKLKAGLVWTLFQRTKKLAR